MVNPTVQFVLGFFFSSFWHFVALMLALVALRGVRYVRDDAK